MKTAKFSDHNILLFLKSLIGNDIKNASLCLSDSFTTDEGMEKEFYLLNELSLFQKLSHLYLLSDESFIKSKLIDADTSASFCEVQLLNKDGDLAYEWCYKLDSNSKILGNGSKCQTVSKVQHCNNDCWWALAVESPHEIIDIRPLFPCEEIWRTNISPDKKFWNLCFKSTDVNTSFYGDFRVRYKSHAEIKRVWMRGNDRPLFYNKPIKINGREIEITAKFPWSLSIKTKTEEKHIEFPRDGSYSFQDEIEWACLTDSLDHDWIYTK
jgi:hypothetical protein